MESPRIARRSPGAAPALLPRRQIHLDQDPAPSSRTRAQREISRSRLADPPSGSREQGDALRTLFPCRRPTGAIRHRKRRIFSSAPGRNFRRNTDNPPRTPRGTRASGWVFRKPRSASRNRLAFPDRRTASATRSRTHAALPRSGAPRPERPRGLTRPTAMAYQSGPLRATRISPAPREHRHDASSEDHTFGNDPATRR